MESDDYIQSTMANLCLLLVYMNSKKSNRLIVCNLRVTYM